MTEPTRFSPFVWPSLLGPLIAGDAACVWAGWYKAHHQYAKRPDPSFDLPRWKADHAERVRELLAAWRNEYPDAARLTENQTRFKLKGATGIELAGSADALLVPASPDEAAVVADVKTGKRKDGDLWQLKLYMDLLPRAKTSGPLKAAASRPIDGVILYGDGVRLVPAQDVTQPDRARIHKMIRTLGGPDVPERRPSVFECARCDIAACPDRLTPQPDAPEPVDETDAF